MSQQVDYEENLITCYGKDRHIHACKPSESKTVCGIPITQKNNITFTNRFWCYECDHALEMQELKQVKTIGQPN